MKRSIAPGAVLLSILMALSFCVAFAENASEDNANVTVPENMTNATANTTEILSNTTNITMPQNETQPGNVTNPFANTKGFLINYTADVSTGIDTGLPADTDTDIEIGN